MIPSLLGNIVGGGVFVGLVYWYLFLAGGEEVEIHFDTMPVDTAVYEQGMCFPSHVSPLLFNYLEDHLLIKKITGGPLQRQITDTGAGTGYSSSSTTKNHIPHSGNGGISGIAKDFHIKHFKKDREMNGSHAA